MKIFKILLLAAVGILASCKNESTKKALLSLIFRVPLWAAIRCAETVLEITKSKTNVKIMDFKQL